MAATGAGALALYEDKTKKKASPDMVALVDAIFKELAANGSFSFATNQVTGTTATQIGPQALTGGAATGGKFDG